MCGIVGIVDFSNNVQVDELSNFTDSLAHRGPDGRGVWTHASRYGFGHRRLAILDLSDNAACPFHYTAPDGHSYVLVFNGEIYNFIEIRRELEQLGHTFRTTSDTEVLVAAFSYWGAECYLRFNGMWAAAILNLSTNTVQLCRDRFGVKPLYYAIYGNRFVFASELKAFLALTHFPRDLNEELVPFSISNSQSIEGLTDQTLFKSVRKLMAGHLIDLSAEGKVTVARWWNTNEHLVQPPQAYGDRVEQFKALFLDACRVRMRSDVPIACSFSGGIDSTAVASSLYHLVRSQQGIERFAGNSIRGYLSSFPGEINDETLIARDAAAELGMPLVESAFQNDYGIDAVFENVWVMEDLYPTLGVPVIRNYRAIATSGTKVSIDGHGGDELLCGYAFYLPAPIGELNAVLYDQFHTRLLPSILRNYDRCSMQSGIEVRMPFMDYRLVSYAFSIPPSDKAGNAYTKLILRDAMKDIMPERVRRRRSKIGFNSPLPTLFNHRLNNILRLIENSPMWHENPWWNGRELSTRIATMRSTRAWIDSDSGFLADLWIKINLTLWYMLFVDRSFKI